MHWFLGLIHKSGRHPGGLIHLSSRHPGGLHIPAGLHWEERPKKELSDLKDSYFSSHL